jgi:hypothetical protein
VNEPRGLTGFTIPDDLGKDTKVEVEYFDYCPKCGKKRLKEEAQRNRLMQIVTMEIVTPEYVQSYMKGEVSKKDFWEEVSRKEVELRKARNEAIKKRNSPSKMKRLEKRKLEREFTSFEGQCRLARGY